MTLKLIRREDVDQKLLGRGINKKCFKCGSKNINPSLTEIVRVHGRLHKQYSCNKCDINND